MATSRKTANKVSQFKNEPFTDFNKKANQAAFKRALAAVKKDLGKQYSIVIDGKKITTKSKLKSLNPANRKQVVGIHGNATAAIATRAVEVAHKNFQTWRHVAPAKRAAILFRTARLLRQRKHYFSALMVYEVGKSWAEADGDTAEAIDFMEYYAREMLRYADGQDLTKVKGERNTLEYIPLGVCAVIPPWNFPLAIMAGMTTAAIVTGNTVVLKPSSDSPTVAAKFFELIHEAGLPKGVLNFCPGPGPGMGDALVKHPLTRFIAFTGSKAVGLAINRNAAEVGKHQLWIKRTILEMGGKDSIVVAEDANLEEAAEGIVSAAFGFQGQKCSACSRAIIVSKVYPKMKKLILEKASKITTGDPTDLANYMGPVVNQKAQKKIMAYIEQAKKEGGKVIMGGKTGKKSGNFILPTIIDNVKPDATVSLEEIFGPVLSMIRVPNFKKAMEVANNTEYGLTGALYSKSRKNIEEARRMFHVGNLYFNRKCTGAFVGVHPFGGFNMSGTDSKAGGKDYLGLFLQAKTMSEKI